MIEILSATSWMYKAESENSNPPFKKYKKNLTIFFGLWYADFAFLNYSMEGERC